MLNHTFKMEKNIRLVVLEHLCHQLNVHVLDVDLLSGCEFEQTSRQHDAYLEALVHDHDGFIQFLLRNS